MLHEIVKYYSQARRKKRLEKRGNMSDKEKIEAILSLLTDQNVGALVKDGALEGEQEEFGALVFASDAFNKAYKIARK